jgi:hypothetical protein
MECRDSRLEIRLPLIYESNRLDSKRLIDTVVMGAYFSLWPADGATERVCMDIQNNIK